MDIQKQRKTYLDFLRILAAFLVIYNHTPGYHFFLEHETVPLKIFCTILASSFTRINVPLFFMISGVLLLGKEESYKTLFSKRILRFAAVLFGASILLYATGHPQDFRFLDAVKDTLTCSVTGVYWFLFSYLGFLFSLPLLRILAIHMTWKEFWLLVLCRTIFSGIPTVLEHIATVQVWYCVPIADYFSLDFSTVNFIFYPLIGYFLAHHFSGSALRKALPLLFAILIGDLLISGSISYQLYTWDMPTQKYLGIFRYLSAISVFLIAKWVFETLQPKIQGHFPEKALAAISSLTLGIYLIDPFLKDRMGLYLKMDEWFHEAIHMVPLSVLYCCVSMTVGGMITWLLRKLPVFKKLL